ncbi:MAG TPA: hypothetical protein DIT25_04620 [Candidatus Moranbacteria bacterium]|nr:hypothetical protein [Candidatus Moranbacteria bacterium]
MKDIFSWTNSKLKLKETLKYGNGIFALENINKGNKIWVLSGEKMDVTEWANRVKYGKEAMNDSLQIGRRTYLDMDRISNTFNHSCSPNAGVRKTSELFALRNIEKGEEITYDYSTVIAPTIWEMRCKCGSNICRKKISHILTIPKKTLTMYVKMGALQDYMKILLKSKKYDKNHFKLPRYEIDALKKLGLINKNNIKKYVF